MPPDRDQTATWSQDLHPDSLVGEDDFTKFLEMEGGFSNFEDLDQPAAHSGLDTPMSRLAFGHPDQMHSMGTPNEDLIHHLDMDLDSLSSSQGPVRYPAVRPGGQRHLPQYPIYQQMQHGYHQRVPPTPVSAEMHGAKFGAVLDGTGQIIYDQQQASFTPLVSPAQTPLDNGWGMPDYVVEDEFFGPLTSPAIEAQQNYASTNTTSSPVDLNTDSVAADPNSHAARKPRRKLNPSSRTAAAAMKQSPGIKPHARRRQASLTSVPADQINAIMQGSSRPARLTPKLPRHAPASDESISPEPLSEAGMRPPPVPQGKSPMVVGKASARDLNAPATPATLMRFPGKQAATNLNGEHAPPPSNNDVMEDISLPDAAADLPLQNVLDTPTRVTRDDDQSTPIISSKTPKLSAESTPRSAGLKAANASQENLSRTARGGKTNKKRQSVSSAAISPALRPKISPSISPLVPNTGQGMPIISAETSALYLASKSNYQNILDGTHLPGVSYPETLAENLSSKRTSHKIAEQGRRNRINLALKEIETLLPSSIKAAAAKKDKNGVKDEAEESNDKQGAAAAAAAAQGASKASTVEMAIIYIKALQAELLETQGKLAAAEKAIAAGNSGDSRASSE